MTIMTVEELIVQLQKFDKNKQVRGEDGFGYLGLADNVLENKDGDIQIVFFG